MPVDPPCAIRLHKTPYPRSATARPKGVATRTWRRNLPFSRIQKRLSGQAARHRAIRWHAGAAVNIRITVRHGCAFFEQVRTDRSVLVPARSAAVRHVGGAGALPAPCVLARLRTNFVIAVHKHMFGVLPFRRVFCIDRADIKRPVNLTAVKDIKKRISHNPIEH